MQIVKMRARVVKDSIDAEMARVIADVERQLAAKYSAAQGLARTQQARRASGEGH